MTREIALLIYYQDGYGEEVRIELKDGIYKHTTSGTKAKIKEHGNIIDLRIITDGEIKIRKVFNMG